MAKEKTETVVLIYKHSDDLQIDKGQSCYNLTHSGKTTYYTSLESAFTSLFHILTAEKFKNVPKQDKEDIGKVLQHLRDHDAYVRGLFEGL